MLLSSIFLLLFFFYFKFFLDNQLTIMSNFDDDVLSIGSQESFTIDKEHDAREIIEKKRKRKRRKNKLGTRRKLEEENERLREELE